MISKNMISPVIEQAQYKNGNFLQSGKVNYNYWYNNTWGAADANSIIVPQTTESKVLSNATDVLLRYHAYDDKGHIISLSKDNGARLGYIWDYNSEYPIAEVTNASIDQVAYTSFEADGSGYWSTGSASRATGGTTGVNCYALSNGSISKSGLYNGTEYVVSYWSANGAYSVSGSAGATQGKTVTINGVNWTYYQHKVTGVSSVTVSGSGSIDELRLYPRGAQMITYTYQPLIGITSKCDNTSQIGYFEYDAFGRLVVIRDQDRNVLKKYCYNYSGQPENCDGTLTYTNAGTSGTYQKQGCASGYTGSQVTYTVNPGTYTSSVSQADADQQAQNEVNANGQAYANTNGTCYIPVYYNVRTNGAFTRNDCATGYTGSSVTYSVAPRTYSSTISQEDADQKAQDDVNANGQAYANANGTCTVVTYYNVPKSGYFNRNDCGSDYYGSMVTYTVVARTYTSNISQEDANQKAQADVDANGQAYANLNGTCTANPTTVTLVNMNFTSQAFDATFTNTSTGAVYTFVISINKNNTTIGTLPIATYNVSIAPTSSSALYEFHVLGQYKAGVNTYTASGLYVNSGELQIDDY